MAERYIYTIRNLTKHFGKKEILKDVNLSFYPGAKIGVIGTNGSGKSTLLKIMAGVDKEFMGEAAKEHGASVGYVPQEPHLTPNKTVLENIEEAVEPIRKLLRRQEEIGDAMSVDGCDFDKLMAEMDRVQAGIDSTDAYNLDRQLDLAMEAMRLPPAEAPVEQLSGGERRRVALCKTLLMKPDLLLLDEPTNHLDAESVEWLERHLQNYPGAVVSVTHDRYFLDNVAKWILELDRGRGIPWDGNYSGWLEQKRKRLAVEEKQESNRQRELERELEWAKMAPRARMSKSKARLANIDKLQAMEMDDKDDALMIRIPPGPPLGDLVVRAENVAKSFGENLLYDELTFNLPKGGIVGIIGPNGAGKSTLFRMIAGKEKPDSGIVKMGSTVKMAFVEQSREELENDKTVWQDVSGGLDNLIVGKFVMPSRAYLGKFNFKGNDQQKLVGNLSGGERGRLHLAKTLIAGANVLMLDEPSNDLDVETLRALEDALLEFAGSIMVISHDRWFLDRIATHILAAEGDSKWTFFDGNYQEYEADKKKRLGEEGAKPKRLRFRPMH